MTNNSEIFHTETLTRWAGLKAKIFHDRAESSGYWVSLTCEYIDFYEGMVDRPLFFEEALPELATLAMEAHRRIQQLKAKDVADRWYVELPITTTGGAR